ncbi:complement C1q-like protein 4 [Clupea harengus]|uniref:Complement C1q-like protein 4 n=1 Tax=Clupea harengus TaxID=7950 RepID=A0A6P8GI24_CLUHA|nr:complement C1q-like protein 4 [Clupea harengus]
MAGLILLLVAPIVLVTAYPLTAHADGGIVAFTAVLQPPSGDGSDGFQSMGPYSSDTTIIYGNVITNIGDAYNSATGIFTAPVKGVYFFTFTTYSWVSSADIGVQLMKNTDEVVMVWENQDRGDNEDYASNSVVLQLKVGDRIYMSLPKGFYIAASSLHNLNTFTGYLLGQM